MILGLFIFVSLVHGTLVSSQYSAVKTQKQNHLDTKATSCNNDQNYYNLYSGLNKKIENLVQDMIIKLSEIQKDLRNLKIKGENKGKLFPAVIVD